MTEFQLINGKVYILENPEAGLVKVGMTNNEVENRRIEVNQMWLGTKGTCQICGVRIQVKRINHQRLIPKHVISGGPCPGGNYLPLEKDTTLAKAHLEKMRTNHVELTGNVMGSNTRRINTLEERIKRFEAFDKRLGVWKINTVYYTDNAENVELRTHGVLSRFLNTNMQFGEVFSCSVEEARKAVETVLEQLGLADSAKKEIIII